MVGFFSKVGKSLICGVFFLCLNYSFGGFLVLFDVDWKKVIDDVSDEC